MASLDCTNNPFGTFEEWIELVVTNTVVRVQNPSGISIPDIILKIDLEWTRSDIGRSFTPKAWCSFGKKSKEDKVSQVLEKLRCRSKVVISNGRVKPV